MTKVSMKQFDDELVSFASAYEIIVLFNQLLGFELKIDTLLAELILLLDESPSIDVDLPTARFSKILRYHLKSQFETLSTVALTDSVRNRMYFASQGIVLPE